MADDEPTTETVHYLGLSQVAEHVGLSLQRITQLRQGGLLPEPDVIVGERYPGWATSTIEAWLPVYRSSLRPSRWDVKATRRNDFYRRLKAAREGQATPT